MKNSSLIKIYCHSHVFKIKNTEKKIEKVILNLQTTSEIIVLKVYCINIGYHFFSEKKNS